MLLIRCCGWQSDRDWPELGREGPDGSGIWTERIEALWNSSREGNLG